MATDINALDTIKSILSTNWNDANTDSKTPVFALIYDQPKQLDMTNDYVLVYSLNMGVAPTGIGATTTATINESIRIDIRVYNNSFPITDDHARKVLAEVRRIIHSNVRNPSVDFDILNPHLDIQDLSDKTRKLFRYVVQIELLSYVRDITA